MSDPPAAPPPTKLKILFDKETGALTIEINGTPYGSLALLAEALPSRGEQVAGLLLKVAKEKPETRSAIAVFLGTPMDVLLEIIEPPLEVPIVLDIDRRAAVATVPSQAISANEVLSSSRIVSEIVSSPPSHPLPEDESTLRSLCIERLQALHAGIITALFPEGRSPLTQEDSPVQQRRNLWRLINFITLIDRSTTPSTDSLHQDFLIRLVTHLQANGVVALLMGSTSDTDFETRLERLVEITITIDYAEPTETYGIKTASLRAAGEVCYPLLQLFALTEGVDLDRQARHLLGDYLSYNSNIRRYQLCGGDQALHWLPALCEAAFWQIVYGHRNYGRVGQAFDNLIGYFGNHPHGLIHAEEMKVMQRSLMIQGRSLTELGFWPYKGNSSTADDYYALAERIGPALAPHIGQPLNKPTDIEPLIDILDEFARREESSEVPLGVRYHVQEVRALLRGENPRRESLSPEEILNRLFMHFRLGVFALNEQIVPAGYYIHVQTPDTALTTDPQRIILGLAYGPVVSRRYIQGPNNKLIEQIFVAGGRMRSAHYTELNSALAYKITYYRNGYPIGEQDFEAAWRPKFCAVFLKDSAQSAAELGVSVDRMLRYAADHEAQHALNAASLQMRPGPLEPQAARQARQQWEIRRTQRRQKFMTVMMRLNPALHQALLRVGPNNEAFLDKMIEEVSAILREGYTDMEVHLLFRERYRSSIHDTAMTIIVALAERFARIDRTVSPKNNYSLIHHELFGTSLSTITSNSSQLPVHRNRGYFVY